MEPLLLHAFHQQLGGHFQELTGHEAVADYGDIAAERAALRDTVGVLDLSCRGRVCITGQDRVRFLHGQVTNDVNRLQTGQGCYAALITAKGKMISDLNIYRLQDELLLDFEPGLTEAVTQRLEHYIIADDVQVVDVRPHYGLLSVQGPSAAAIVRELDPNLELPSQPMSFVSGRLDSGDRYVMNNARLGTTGFDLFLPVGAMERIATQLSQLARTASGRFCGWTALDIARIEAGIPRFGIDMDASNLPPEAGLEARAISYSKGCYIGQEVIARIRTYGRVAKKLCGLRLDTGVTLLPRKGDKLFEEGREVGFVTSALDSRALRAKVALGYVRRETHVPGKELVLRTEAGESRAWIVPLPFQPSS